MNTQIKNFLESLKNDDDFKTGFAPHVRLPANHELVRKNKVTQIRSKKNDLLAYQFDVLGNMTALHTDGSIRQYVSDREINKVIKGK